MCITKYIWKTMSLGVSNSIIIKSTSCVVILSIYIKRLTEITMTYRNNWIMFYTLRFWHGRATGQLGVGNWGHVRRHISDQHCHVIIGQHQVEVFTLDMDIHTYMFVVVNVDVMAQESDFRIEKRQVVFLWNWIPSRPNAREKKRMSYWGSS